MGRKHTEETKKMMRERRKGKGAGRKLSQAHKDAIREGLNRPEVKKKISKANKGRKFTEEHKKKIGLANKGKHSSKGRKHTEESKKKMSLSKMGDKNPMKDPEVAKKVSDAQKGKSLEELGHKEDCSCFVCRMKRGEVSKEEHPWWRTEVREARERAVLDYMCSDKNPMKDSEIAKRNGELRKGRENSYKGCERPWISEAMKGENNPQWQGGCSFFPYTEEFKLDLKRKIRKRDKNICQVCGKTKEAEGKNMAVHHINYKKECCEEYNLICLCGSCHIATNSNRETWQQILSEKVCVWLGT